MKKNKIFWDGFNYSVLYIKLFWNFMKLFVYKTLIIIFLAFVLFEFTIGKEIKKLEDTIKTLNSERGREIIADKIRKEIERANQKENILAPKDRKLLSVFINKIIAELNSDNSQ